MLNIEKKQEGEKAEILLDGRLDTVTAPELEEELKKIYPETSELVIDFEKLEYLSSNGLRMLLLAQKAMNEQGSMKVCKVSEPIMEIFEITGFLDVLTIE